MKRLFLVFAVLTAVAACGYSDPYANTSGQGVASVIGTTPTPVPGQDDFNAGAGIKPVKFPDGLQIIDIKVGDGQLVKKNDQLSVQYTGWLGDGEKFDSSRDRGQPFDVTIGQQQVIAGWDEGIPGMKVGGIRKLIIPSSLGYGDQGQGQAGSPGYIPPGATLVFLVEVAADKGPAPPSPSPSVSPS
ncbi:MAG TPA: FKBP-type peptidyl-prolyl cis-trans isomerase [Candidatus Dormibacteraeota bacterium]